MATNPLSVNVPQPSVPFLDQAGGVSRAWLYYLLTLLNRTGGVQGISSGEIVIQTNAVAIQTAMDDVEFPAPSPTFAMDVVMDDGPSMNSIANAALLALSISDAEPGSPLNPIIASLLVSDIA